MAKEYRTIRNDVALPYQWALGKTWTRFFDGLREEKILGTRCRKCARIFVPARTCCPNCFVDMKEWVEVGTEGRLVSWTVVREKYHGQVKEPPYIAAIIKLAGSDCGFHHFIGGLDLEDMKTVTQKLKPGAKVKAVWRTEKKSDMNDIAYFAPAGK